MKVMKSLTYEQKYKKSRYLSTDANEQIKLILKNKAIPIKINMQILETV